MACNVEAMMKILDGWHVWKETPEGRAHTKKQIKAQQKRLAEKEGLSLDDYQAKKEAEWEAIFSLNKG